MKNRVYGYLRASTSEQNAGRAESDLNAFAEDKGFTITTIFRENESGATLERPELFRLLDICESGDVLLVEQVDRLSRLSSGDWDKLKQVIQSKGVRVVSLDLPTSYMMLSESDSFTGAMIQAINGMLLDMLAAVARKDYEDRRRRQKQGIDAAKVKGKYKGRPVDSELHARIAKFLEVKASYSEIQSALKCSRATISKVVKQIKRKETVY